MLPEQVRRRAERANELIAQLNGQANPDGTPPEPRPDDPPSDPAPAPQDPPAATPAPTPEPTPAPTPAPADDPNSETWRQKYLTLQGVFNAESRKAQQREQAFEARIAALESAAKPAPPAPTPTPQSVQYTQEERDRYGDDLLNLIASKAKVMAEDIVTQRMAQLQPTIDQTRQEVQQVGQVVYKSKTEEFWGELADAVPDHAVVNVDPRWLQWLGQVDPLSGFPRQALLDDAAGKLDHTRVANLFKAFKKEAGIEEPAPVPTPSPVATPPISPSPRAVGQATAPTPREPQVPAVKRSEIRAHYRRSSTDPTYRASKEYGEMEQRITQATVANRIVEG